MATEKKIICPYSQKECIKDGAIVVVNGIAELHGCPAWVNIIGRNPQTGEDVNQWKCSVLEWMPILTIENSKLQRETGAAVESFRNEMVKSNESSQQLLLTSVKMYTPLL